MRRVIWIVAFASGCGTEAPASTTEGVDAGSSVVVVDAGASVVDDDAGTTLDAGSAVDAGTSIDAGTTLTDAGVAPLEPGAWIGAACTDACNPAGSMCRTDWPGGSCTLPCSQFCPDDPSAPETFCVDDGADGACVSRCDLARFPSTGCRDGYVCAPLPRHNDSSTVHDVCVPAGFDGAHEESCVEEDAPALPNVNIVEPDGLDGCPPGMALVGGVNVCMDRWEAFLVAVDDAGNESAFSPFINPGSALVRAKSAPGAVPQSNINEIEAAGACALAGKRLCTNPEWTRACRGSSGFTYPYGNTRSPGVCNDHRDQHPAIEYFGTSASWIWSQLGNECIDQQADTVDLTGANAQCVDESGKFFDLMGNLHEWIDDPAGTFRGGYYVDTVLNGNGCLYTTTAHDVSHWDYSTGFRCCADP